MPNLFRRKPGIPVAEAQPEERLVIDVTDTADQVPPEDYPILVFLRDQLRHAHDETEKLRQQLAVSQGSAGGADSGSLEGELRAQFEKRINDERAQRKELEASLESERRHRIEAEKETQKVQEELARARYELKAVMRSQPERSNQGAVD